VARAALAGFVGSVFQEPEHQFLARTVADELELGPLRLGSPPAVARERRDELLARLHLERLADANPFTLSGGSSGGCPVGTALATRPQLLVLDEPTFGQDARTWRELLDLLAGTARRGSGRAAGHARRGLRRRPGRPHAGPAVKRESTPAPQSTATTVPQ
jgi:energy-coupling factor transport system ATP-binding protein